ncbi:HDOD domain-containing protein [Desulfonatronum lacustre]|uniref:HDOD domain-containing protein n=1 Tax=Desulfonatronum lacustre TaxID=66849 RepID=UPI00048FB583|nr:HDOD domain-containing protein [Desulfonatronum lacustre]
MIKRKIILSQITRVPVLSSAVQEGMRLLRDPQVDMGNLAKVLQHDPGITANILRLANTPYFGSMSRVNNLRDAVVRLGAKRVSQLLLTVAVTPRISGELEGYDQAPCTLLEQSLAIAVASELTAAELGIDAPSHTFTAGLLANIGKIVLSQFLDNEYEQVNALVERENVSFEEAERRVLGADHAEIGAELLASWNLPEEIVRVVRHFRNPESCAERDVALDLVHIGSAAAAMTGIGQGLDGMQYPVSEAVVERLGLTEEQVQEVMVKLLEHVAKLKEVLPKCEKEI